MLNLNELSLLEDSNVTGNFILRDTNPFSTGCFIDKIVI